jgi:hypothetical protein
MQYRLRTLLILLALGPLVLWACWWYGVILFADGVTAEDVAHFLIGSVYLGLAAMAVAVTVSNAWNAISSRRSSAHIQRAEPGTDGPRVGGPRSDV